MASPHADDIAQVYYINLDMRPDRDAYMRAMLAHGPWPHARIPAVRLSRPPATLGLRLAEEVAQMPHVASIFLSHRRALEAMLRHPRDGRYLLLEDDVAIGPAVFAQGILPDGMPERWQTCLVSPRFKCLVLPADAAPPEQPPFVWLRDPFGGQPVTTASLPPELIVTGAHFTLFNGKQAVAEVLAAMDQLVELYDVDRWYVRETEAVVFGHPAVGVQVAFGTNHFDGILAA